MWWWRPLRQPSRETRRMAATAVCSHPSPRGRGGTSPATLGSFFGPAVWIRFLIQPAPGNALAYIDYEQQEFGIAAYLSGDEAMMAAYESGDSYLAFAKQAGAVPLDATKQSHARAWVIQGLRTRSSIRHGRRRFGRSSWPYPESFISARNSAS